MMGKAEWAHALVGGLSAWGAGGSAARKRRWAGSGENVTTEEK